MFVLTALKTISTLAVGVGARKIAVNIVKEATPEVASKALQVGYAVVGSIMVGGIVKSTMDYYTGTIDDVVKFGKTMKEFRNARKETKEAKVVEDTTKIEG